MIAPRTRRPVSSAASAFTMIELLVAVAILAILFSLMFRPLLMAIEILSIGRGEKQAQNSTQTVLGHVTADMNTAYKVFSNLATYDLATGGSAGGKWRTSQLERISLVAAARDSQGRLLSPLQAATRTLPGGGVQTQTITYWVERSDVTKPYDYLTNPRRLFRAIGYFSGYSEVFPPTPTPGQGQTTLSINSPDDVYLFAVRKIGLSGSGSLASFGPTIAPLFVQGGPLDWYVANTDKTFSAAPSATGRVMRSPAALANGTADAYTNTLAFTAVSPLTEAGTDIREFTATPHRTDLEQLAVNRSFSAYRGTQKRWQQPYQRSSDGLWTNAATGVVSTSGGVMPLLGMFRVEGTRDAAGTLATGYFLSIDQDPASATVGHTLLYRLPTAAGGATVPVYDTTDYPKRVFAAAPGTTNANGLSGEMACGLNFDSGEIECAFPAQDIIVPDSTGAQAAVVALNNHNWVGTPSTAAPLYAAGVTTPASVWQSFKLTTTGQPGNNGVEVDDDSRPAAAPAPYRWTGYTLSAFRPERLQTGALALPTLSARQLNMSVIPGSVRVVVEQGYLDAASATGWTAVATRTFQAVEAAQPGATPQLAPNRYYLDPSSGKLVFYDAQLVGDASVARDGFNPPEDLNVTLGGHQIRTIIRVDYEFRNNLPTIYQVLTGNDANRDVVEMTYRSLNVLDLRLTIDVAADSTRGVDESIGDPSDATVAALVRPSGARRRVTTTQTLTCGGG